MLGVDLPGEVGYNDVVGVDVALMTFDDGVETDEAVGECEFEFLRYLLVELEVDVGIVKSDGFEEVGRVAFGSTTADGVGLDAGDDGSVEVQVGAVFSAEGGPFLYLVHHITLQSHLAGGLCCIGVHGEEGVGVLLGDRGDVVDVEHLAGLAADRLEAHVVDTFGLDVGAETALGVSCRDEESLTLAVDVVVYHVGILSFACVFGL